MLRFCSGCEQHLGPGAFSEAQWNNGIAKSLCLDCDIGGEVAAQTVEPFVSAANRNNATRGVILKGAGENPFAQGAFRYVEMCQYTEGERAGQAAVCKWFKTGIVFEDKYFEKDIKAVHKALEIINKFNRERHIDLNIKLNTPEVWTRSSKRRDRSNSLVLVEPFIENYQRFNSNTVCIYIF